MFLAPTIAMSGTPSLNATDWINDLEAEINGIKSTFTVIKDSSSPSQWYYIPDEPRISEKKINNTLHPDFSLIKYQGRDGNGNRLEKAILQFSVRLSLPSSAIKQLKQQIKSSTGQDNILLSALPIEKGTVSLFEKAKGNILISKVASSGLTPTFATQKMSFQVDLTKLGADVYEALTSDTTGGIGIAAVFSYKGLTPALKCEAKFNWKKAHKYFGEDKKAAAEVSLIGFLGGNAQYDTTKIKQTLTQAGALEINAINSGSSDLPSVDCDKLVVQPLLKRISTTLFSPESVDVQAAKAIVQKISKDTSNQKKKGSWWSNFFSKFTGSASYNVKRLDISRIQDVEEIQTFTTRQVVTQKTAVSGFIGIGHYPDAVKEKLILEIASDSWDSVLAPLPQITYAEVDVSSIDLSIGLDTEKVTEVQRFRWVKEAGSGSWKDIDGNSVTYVYFPLQGKGMTPDEIKNLNFKMNASIVRNNKFISQSINISSTQPISDEILSPFSSLHRLNISVGDLAWKKIDKQSNLISVGIKLYSNKGTVFTRRFKPVNVNNVLKSPDPIDWFVEEGENILTDITYNLDSGERVKWSGSGSNLIEDYEGGIELLEAHYKK